MHRTPLCIVARSMSWTAGRAARYAATLLVAAAVVPSIGCDKLDGRNRNRAGNRLFHDKQFVDAAAQYERALAEVDDPLIHYNLGLAYSKLFRPGADKPILLDLAGSEACSTIPGVQPASARVCVKATDKSFHDCDDKNVCPSSFQCLQSQLCALPNAALADLSAKHFTPWLAVQEDDDVIEAKLKKISAERSEITQRALANAAQPNDDQRDKTLKEQQEDLETKKKVRTLMTEDWLQSDQAAKAVAFWDDLRKLKPNDANLVGTLAGVNLKAGDWRKSIEWYTKLADLATDPAEKAQSFQFIGNVAWGKLHSKTLNGAESIEVADRGIGALQKASALQPENPKPIGLMGAIFHLRGLTQGVSWAGALDRATAEDLKRQSGVLKDKAKALQGQPAAPTPAPATVNGAAPATPSPAKTGG